MAEKKQWTKPQLVIIGRGAPEEQVLLACKQFLTRPSPGPTRDSVWGCYVAAACYQNATS